MISVNSQKESRVLEIPESGAPDARVLDLSETIEESKRAMSLLPLRLLVARYEYSLLSTGLLGMMTT